MLLFIPSQLARLLFGEMLTAAGETTGRLAGIALLAFVFACWPSRTAPAPAAVHALSTFNLACAGLLAWHGLSATATGPLLWPASALHGALGIVLLWCQRAHRA